MAKKEGWQSVVYTDVIVGVLLLLAVYFDRIRGGDSYE
jgi:hypothetical protein